MTATTTTRRRQDVRRNPGTEIWYVVSGPRGSVTYSALEDGAVPVCIGFHGSRPAFEGEKPGECEFEPSGICYADQTFTGAQALHQAHAEAEGNDEVIWRELERRYADRWGQVS